MEVWSLLHYYVRYVPLSCPMHKNRCIVSIKNITTSLLGWGIVVLDKYILFFRQIYFVIWTNIRTNTICDVDKYILWFVQIQLMIFANTLPILHPAFIFLLSASSKSFPMFQLSIIDCAFFRFFNVFCGIKKEQLDNTVKKENVTTTYFWIIWSMQHLQLDLGSIY